MGTQGNHCTIRIVTLSEGKRSVFSARGIYSRTAEELILSYETEGDPSTLLIAERSVTMERRGGVRLFVRFEEGVQSSLSTSLGGLSGLVPVHTRKLSVRTFPRGVKAHLEYDLIFGDGFSHFVLHVSAIFSEDT